MASLSDHFLQSIADGPHNIQLSIFLFLLSFLFLFAGYRSRRKQPQLNLPPAPAAYFPFIGHLLHLRSTPHISFHHLSRKYGPLIRLNLGFQFPTIVASSPETAAQILKTFDTHFCSRPSLASTDRYSYGGLDISFSPYNLHWKKLRHIANAHLFNPGMVQSLSPVREQEVGAVVEFLSVKSSSPVNVSNVLVSLFNNILFREVFGRRPATTGSGGEDEMKTRYHDLIMEVGAFMADFGWGDLFPSLAWLDAVSGWKGKLERSFRAIDAVFEEEIAERMSRRGGDEEDCCFLDVLLRRRSDDRNEKNDSLGLELSKTEIKAVLLNMFIGGTETSASAIEWGMARLMKNPEAMRRAQDEIRRVAGGRQAVKESDLQELHYLKMVIKETLRLHPPAPLLLFRECLKDAKVEGFDIPAKARVIVNAWSIGRDPKHWDCPEEFRPERFDGSHVSYKGSHFELIPFGAGRRICPGLALGIAGVELAMANLLYRFDWRLPAGKREEDFGMEESPGIVTHRKDPLILVPAVASPETL